MKTFLFIALLLLIAGCSQDWSCRITGKTMYSISSGGELGSADRGCSCQQIRAFERKTFGYVDEEALKSDFGC